MNDEIKILPDIQRPGHIGLLIPYVFVRKLAQKSGAGSGDVIIQRQYAAGPLEHAAIEEMQNADHGGAQKTGAAGYEHAPALKQLRVIAQSAADGRKILFTDFMRHDEEILEMIQNCARDQRLKAPPRAGRRKSGFFFPPRSFADNEKSAPRLFSAPCAQPPR